MDEPLMTLAEVSRATRIPYYRITYAHQVGALPEPARVGNLRVYTAAEADAIRAYFARRDKEGHAPRHRQPAI